MSNDHDAEELAGPGASPDDARDGADVDPGWPWSFILLVVAGAAYLIFRLVEAVAGLF